MTFLIDENLSRNIAAGLRGFGFPVTHVKDELEPLSGTGSISDEQVFKHCERKKWFLVTGDWRMHKNRAQRAAMSRAGLGVFILTGRGELSLQNLRLFMVKRMPELIRLAESTNRPFVFGVPQSGSIRRLDKPSKRGRR